MKDCCPGNNYLSFLLLLAICLATMSEYCSAQSKVGEILPPKGFVRIENSSETKTPSFGKYLRALPLKALGTPVRLYDGTEKYWQGGAYAVIDMEIGRSDLQQCADAVIRLRAEYLWSQKRYQDIHFNFTSGFRADYVKWAEGYRIKVDGNKVSWYKATERNYEYATFRKYLNIVFSYAGTASLKKELTPTQLDKILPGDVFIQGGFPGHAMMVADVAKNDKGQIAIMVVQSYMPAQDIHIVTNLDSPSISPWYIIDDSTQTISFPEWTFSVQDLRQF